jgi:ketosteroid isomerase-like protein
MDSPIDVVDRYLQLCEDRQLEQASTFLDDEVVMVFPGDATYRSLDEMVQGARGRYSWVKKNRTDFSSSESNGESIVTSRGTLYGEKVDGTPFSGIRYIDFFVLRDNKIIEQHVWNDLAELGITTPTVKE